MPRNHSKCYTSPICVSFFIKGLDTQFSAFVESGADNDEELFEQVAIEPCAVFRESQFIMK